MTAPVRPLALEDLPGLMEVQRACYGEGYVESSAVYARRLTSPAQCSLAIGSAERLCAYVGAYDTLAGRVTPLHGDFEAAAQPDTLYLHDLAVRPELAGQGLARTLLAPLWRGAAARGLARSALVAVQGSQGFWERHGYAVHPLREAAQRQRLAAYGAGAVYMVRTLA